MEITEVRVFTREGNDKKLKAYATITIDNAFVVRNIKVIEGNRGLFVAMPSRKIKEPCTKCGFKNVVRSKFCNQCGSNLPVRERKFSAEGASHRESEHKDVAHPITLECREYIQKKVLDAYDAAKSSAPTEKVEAPKAELTSPPQEAPPQEAPPQEAPPQEAPPQEAPKPEEPKTEGGDIEL